MKKIFSLIILFLITLSAYAAIPHYPNKDEIILGKGANAVNKLFTIDVGDGGSNPSLLIDATLKDFSFNKEMKVLGNNFYLGDGAASDKKWIFDVGLGAANPFYKWDNALGKLVFSNDGSLEKKIGSGAGAGGDGGVNYLANPGAEDGVINWTNTGGTYTQETHTNGTEDNVSFFRLAASGVGQFLESDPITIADTNGAGCMFDMKYNQGAGLFDYKVLKSPFADPADVISTGEVGTLTNFTKAPTQTFACSPGDILRARVTSTAAATIDLDDFYLGSNKGFIPSSTIEKTETQILASNLTGIGTIFTFSNLNIGSRYVVRGQILVNDDDAANNLKTIVVEYRDGATVVALAKLSESDGIVINNTISSNFEFVATDATFTVEWTSELRFDILGDNTRSQTFVQLTEKPESGVEAWTPEQADFRIDSTLNNGLITFSNAVSGTIEDASGVLTNKKSAATVVCSDGSQGGSTCTTGNELVAIRFNAPVVGTYRACIDFSADTNGAMVQYYRMAQIDPTSPTSTIYQSTYEKNYNGITAGLIDSPVVCDDIDISSVGDVAFALHARVSSATADYFGQARWTVQLVSHNVSRPIIQNMVDTSAGSGGRVNGCKIDNNGTATVDVSSGLCDSWMNTVNRSSIGVVDAVFIVGEYSSPPVCTCTAYISGNDRICSVSSITTSGLTVDIKNGGNASLDNDFTLNCIGAR